MSTSQPLPDSPHDALRRAVELVGSQAAVARLLGISQPSVWKWISRQKVLPAEHVLAVEAASGVPKEQLRPDLYRLDDGATTPPSAKLEAAR